MTLFFLFKRTVGMMVQPLPVVFLLVLLAAVFVVLRKRRAAVVSGLLAAMLLFAATFPPLVRLLAWPLESRYPPLVFADGRNPALVMVLGNGVAHPDDPTLPALTRLNDCARARLVEGVRLARLFPNAVLVVSGYGMGLENCADAMAGAAAELGVPPERIRLLPESLDTEHEARLTAELAGGGEVVLVTTASHMPRAVGFFADQGVRVTPAPCDYIGPRSPESRQAVNRHRWRPRAGSLADSEELWHEYLGLLYYKLFRS
ncbi:MAG: YdcF family protein [Planctomycetaceae bacterium]|nr:YdcF family protein [Planctomycetaceae bacterium]